MKKIIVLLTMLMVVMVCNAQEKKDVTKFMGIPVDGTKIEMIQKLKAKGFTYDVKLDCLKGEFNGSDVILVINTDKGKVCSITVVMGGFTGYDESLAKIVFNSLSQEFEKNPKYVTYESHLIEEDEDISYEMSVNSKSYINIYLQNGDKMKPVMMTILTIRRTYNYNIGILYYNEYNSSNGEDL